MKSVDLSANSIKYYDCVVISTDHDVYNYDMIQENAQLIVDSRGRYRKSFLNVIKA
jgi:UDP-N-acetyl-D-glucosamine dehydrogenase